jgi:DNA-binding PadR family transcriptional regulator
MSVRAGILAVLSLGPAYGSQVHGEVETRMHRIGSINVGQIYSTLDRLQTQGCVVSQGVTGDGLPLYALTPDGLHEVEAWITRADAGSSWADFVGHVLLVASLPGAPVESLVTSYRQAFAAQGQVSPDSAADPLSALAERADGILSHSALAWLDEVQDVLATTDLARPLGSLRPRRGRRPRQAG